MHTTLLSGNTRSAAIKRPNINISKHADNIEVHLNSSVQKIVGHVRARISHVIIIRSMHVEPSPIKEYPSNRYVDTGSHLKRNLCR